MVASIAWKPNADGDWGVAANWKPQRLPNATDDVKINTADFHTITYSGGTTTVSSLTVGNDAISLTGGMLTLSNASSFANALSVTGTLNVNGPTTVSGLFSLTNNGAIGGTGTLTLEGGANIDNGFFAGSGRAILEGATTVSHWLTVNNGYLLENAGTFTISAFDTTIVSLGLGPGPSGAIQNDVGATLTFASHAVVQGLGAGAMLVNAGTIIMDAHGEVDIAVPLTNTGTITLTSGLLNLGAGTSDVSGIAISAGALQVSGAFTFTGGGTLGVTNSTFWSNGGVSTFTEDTTLQSLLQTRSGVINGPGTLTLAGGAQFHDFYSLPTEISGAGLTILQGQSAVETSLSVKGRSLENQGTLSFNTTPSTGPAEISLDPAATFTNTAAGSIVIQSDYNGAGIISEGKTAVVNNAGTITSFGSSSYIDGVVFNNTGTVHVAAGAMFVLSRMIGDGIVQVNNGAKFVFQGTAIAKPDEVNVFVDAGSVSLTGSSRNDSFSITGRFDSNDRVSGGLGRDTFSLTGDHSGGLIITSAMMKGIETLQLGSGYSYDLTTTDAVVATGATLAVDGSMLSAGDVLRFNGAQETDAAFRITGGLGADDLTGGALADVFVYRDLTHSTSVHYDVLHQFDFDTDKLDIIRKVKAIDGAITTGTLDAGSFDALLSAALAGHLGKHHAIQFTPDAGTLAGHTFLIVDSNGVAGYQAGADLVIETANATGSLTTTTFI